MEVKDILLEIITDLGIEVDENEKIRDINSITFVSLIVRIEETFDIIFPDEYLLLDRVSEVHSLVTIIEQQLEDYVWTENRKCKNKGCRKGFEKAELFME